MTQTLLNLEAVRANLIDLNTKGDALELCRQAAEELLELLDSLGIKFAAVKKKTSERDTGFVYDKFSTRENPRAGEKTELTFSVIHTQGMPWEATEDSPGFPTLWLMVGGEQEWRNNSNDIIVTRYQLACFVNLSNNEVRWIQAVRDERPSRLVSQPPLQNKHFLKIAFREGLRIFLGNDASSNVLDARTIRKCLLNLGIKGGGLENCLEAAKWFISLAWDLELTFTNCRLVAPRELPPRQRRRARKAWVMSSPWHHVRVHIYTRNVGNLPASVKADPMRRDRYPLRWLEGEVVIIQITKKRTWKNSPNARRASFLRYIHPLNGTSPLWQYGEEPSGEMDSTPPKGNAWWLIFDRARKGLRKNAWRKAGIR